MSSYEKANTIDRIELSESHDCMRHESRMK